MKNLTLIVLVLTLFPACNAIEKLTGQSNPSSERTSLAEKRPLKIMIAGQSNGVSGAQLSDPWGYSLTGRVKVEDISIRHSLGVPTEQKKISNNLSWLILGDKIANMYNRDVEIYNQARGNTSTRDWVTLGFAQTFWERAEEIQPDIILWLQGGSDTLQFVGDTESYDNMRTIFDKIKKVSPNSIVFITLEGLRPYHESLGSAEANVRTSQKRMIREGRARQGVDHDLMRLEHPDWFENGNGGPEFSGNGFQGHADAWFLLLKGNSLLNSIFI